MKKILLFLATLLAGCTTPLGETVPMGGVKYSAVPTENVMILFSTPTREHVQIGLVSSLGGTWTSDGEMYKKMQQNAATLGADAIIVRSAETATSGAAVVQTVTTQSGFNYPRTTAIAIKYK